LAVADAASVADAVRILACVTPVAAAWARNRGAQYRRTLSAQRVVKVMTGPILDRSRLGWFSRNRLLDLWQSKNRAMENLGLNGPKEPTPTAAERAARLGQSASVCSCRPRSIRLLCEQIPGLWVDPPTRQRHRAL
jgi:hypothetical protein